VLRHISYYLLDKIITNSENEKMYRYSLHSEILQMFSHTHTLIWNIIYQLSVKCPISTKQDISLLTHYGCVVHYLLFIWIEIKTTWLIQRYLLTNDNVQYFKILTFDHFFLFMFWNNKIFSGFYKHFRFFFKFQRNK